MVLGLATWEFTLLLVLIFFFLASAITTAIIILVRLRWRFKVVILEGTASGNTQIVGRDRARLIAVSDGGEELFVLKKRKKYKGATGKRIGKNQVAWMIGDDGYWYNVDFGNFNKSLYEVGLNPLDRNVRLATASMRKLIEKNYGNKSWMEKYGNVLYFGMFMMVILAFAGVMWFAFDKQLQMASATKESVETSKAVMELAKEVLSNIDNIKSGTGGSGLIASG
jgi:hypothetical protein